jgi:hypothetical protein
LWFGEESFGKMSKPAHKEDEDVLSSGSDTETESEEDEDTVSVACCRSFRMVGLTCLLYCCV